MHISAIEEYGLRCALQLAQLGSNGTIAASMIAEKEGLSVQYASKIMHLFRKAELVSAMRGIQGGFRLKKNANEITLKEVFTALRDEKTSDEFCSHFKGQQNSCVHLDSCAVRPVWQILTGYFDSVLEQITLADLASGEKESKMIIDLFAKKEAEKIHKKFQPSGTKSMQQGSI